MPKARSIKGEDQYDPGAGRLPRVLLNAARAMEQRTHQVLADCGLTQPMFEVLQVLDKFGELSATEISRITMVSKQAITPRLEIMEDDGYLTRVWALGEGHRYRVEITPDGRTAFRSAQRRLTALESAIRKALGPQYTSSLVEELFALGNALRAMG